ncbi:MAG: hypothetical protein ACREKH_03945, partial [Candidatus Rokuibacteriota bacterium]
MTAGVVAGQTKNTRCGLLTLANAAGVSLDRMLDGTRWRAPFGQAASAIARGRLFERRVKADGYAVLLALLQDELGLDVSTSRIVNLRAEVAHDRKDPYRGLDLRARRTREIVAAFLAGDPSAPHIIDGAILTIRLGGQL